MTAYLGFVFGMLVLAAVLGFAVPTLLSADSTLLVCIAFAILLVGVPAFIRLYFGESISDALRALGYKRGSVTDETSNKEDKNA